MESPSLCPGRHEVRAWYAATSNMLERDRLEHAMSWLAPAERERYARFYREDDRRMFLLGRVMARLLVGRAAGTAPTGWQWREGSHGRPEIAWPASPLRFNIAHSAGLVVCALAMGREVGIDVEDLTRRAIDPGLVRRYCAPSEVTDIEAQPADARQHRFLQYWTLKEAYLKARGVGISLPLADIGFSLGSETPSIAFRESLAGADDRWMFHLTQPTERHLMAIAASTADGVQPTFIIERFAMTMMDSDGRPS